MKEQLNWIPVTERTPDQGVMVMATLIDRQEEEESVEFHEMHKVVHGETYNRWISYEMWFKGDHWYDTGLDGPVGLKEVLAWHPLFDVYKGN